MRPSVNFVQERVVACGYRERDAVRVGSFLQVSCSSNESAVQQK